MVDLVALVGLPTTLTRWNGGGGPRMGTAAY